MAQAYFYSSTAVQTQLNTGISNSATTCQVASTVGWPVNYPYVIAIDYGGPLEELCTVTANNLGLLTITRAFDSTSAQIHGIGAIVRHVYCGKDANDFRIHEGNTAGVHGVTGSVVGTSDTQTLTNKTLTTPTIAGATVSGTWSGTFAGSPTFSGSPVFSGGPVLTSGGSIGGTWQSTSTLFTASASTNSGLSIRGAASQSVDIFRVQNSTPASMFTVTFDGRALVSPTNTANGQLVVNGPSGLTGDLADWQVNGVTLSRVTAAGAYSGPNLILSGNPTTTVPLSVTATNATTVNIASVVTAQATGLTLSSNGSLSLSAPGTSNTLSATAYIATSAIAADSTNLLAVANYSGSAGLTLPNVNYLNGTAGALFAAPVLVTSGNSVTDALVVNNTSGAATLLMRLQAAGVTEFTVDKSGNAVATGTVTANNVTVTTSYSPTLSGGALTLGNGTVTGQFTRSGSQVFVTVQITAGSTTTLAATGNLTISLPGGLTPVIQAVGTGWFTKTSGGASNLAVSTASASSTTATFFTTPSGVLNSFNTGNAAAVATGSTIIFVLPYLV